jgi:hypothetical protein
LIWTVQAINDLGGIGDYIAENLEKYAKLTMMQSEESVVKSLTREDIELLMQ